MSEGIGQLSAALIAEPFAARVKEARIIKDFNLSHPDFSDPEARVLMPLTSIVRRDFSALCAAAMFAFVSLGLAAAPARAVDGDTQVWNTQNFNYKINDRWSANLETQERWYGDVSYLAFFIVQPSVTYKWNDWLSLTGGYAHFRVYDGEGDFADEDRIWEQANVRLFGGKGEPTLNWRTRLEQRIFEAGGDTVWRLREQLRLVYPIVDRVQGVAWTEAFWRLNDAVQANGRLQESGIEQWRNFAGLNLEVSENFTFEAGYMNVYTWRTSGDTIDHVPWLISTFKF